MSFWNKELHLEVAFKNGDSVYYDEFDSTPFHLIDKYEDLYQLSTVEQFCGFLNFQILGPEGRFSDLKDRLECYSKYGSMDMSGKSDENWNEFIQEIREGASSMEEIERLEVTLSEGGSMIEEDDWGGLGVDQTEELFPVMINKERGATYSLDEKAPSQNPAYCEVTGFFEDENWEYQLTLSRVVSDPNAQVLIQYGEVKKRIPENKVLSALRELIPDFGY